MKKQDSTHLPEPPSENGLPGDGAGQPRRRAYTVSDAVIKQKQNASRVHGADAFIFRGPDALNRPQRSRLAEITQYTADRDSVILLMRERTAHCVMLAELAEAWIRDQAERGVPFDKMTLLNRITTFQESARRHLVNLASMLNQPGAGDDVTQILSGNARKEKDDDNES